MDGGFRETDKNVSLAPNRAWFTEGEDMHLKMNKQIDKPENQNTRVTR